MIGKARAKLNARFCSTACYSIWRKGRFTGAEHWSVKRNASLLFTPEQWQIIYGSVLGDGSLGKPKNGVNYHLTIAHSTKQVDYLLWKRHLLAPLTSEPNVYRRADVRHGKVYETWRFHTPSLVSLTDLHRECYPDGKKCLPLSLLERCGPLALAVWYMDDGSNGGGVPQFATVCFPSGELEMACDWFRTRWGICATVTSDNRVSIQGRSRAAFRDLIEPHVPACMAYKLPPPLTGRHNRYPH